MAKASSERSVSRYHQSFLPDNDLGKVLRLNATKQRASLNVDVGEVSDLAGLDVMRPWRRMDPRIPIDGNQEIGYLDEPVVGVIENSFDGNGVWSITLMHAPNGVTISNTSVTLTAGMHNILFDAKGWPSFLIGGLVIHYFNSTDRYTARIVGIDSVSLENDRLLLDSGNLQAPANGNWVRIETVIGFPGRGIWAHNGYRMRKFFDSAYAANLSMEIPEAIKGGKWRGARISNNRFMFVSDRAAPRVVTLRERSTRDPIIVVAGVGASYTAATASITLANAFTAYNLAERDFVVVTFATSPYLPGIFEIASKQSVNEIRLEADPLGSDTTNVTFFVVRRPEEDVLLAGPVHPFSTRDLANKFGPNDAITMSALGAGGSTTAGETSVRVRLVDLDTGAISPFYQCGKSGDPTSDVLAIVANDQVRITFSRTSTAIQRCRLHHRAHLVQIYRKLSAGDQYFLELQIPLTDLLNTTETGDYTKDLILSDTDLQRKPILLDGDTVKGLPPAGRDIAVLGDTGTVLIAGKADADIFQDPLVDGMRYSPWPKVDNDNVVHFSRTDAHEPENFPPRATNQITLSRIGDRFQRFVIAGDDVLAVMARGVYRLTSGGILGVSRIPIAEKGLGTPWPDSVIPVEDRAMWVNENNAYLYDPSFEGTENANPLRIGDSIQAWLKDAQKQGDDIQSFFDSRRRVIIIRRIKTDGKYQDWEFSLITFSGSFVEDRNSVALMSALGMVSGQGDNEVLCSIGEDGRVFEIGRDLAVGDTIPYDGALMQAVLDGTFTIDSQSIQKAGQFSVHQLGETIRFRSSNPAVDGQVRVIKRVKNNLRPVPLAFEKRGAVQLVHAQRLRDGLGLMAYRWNNSGTWRAAVRAIRMNSDGLDEISSNMHISQVADTTPHRISIAVMDYDRAVVLSATGSPALNFTEVFVESNRRPDVILSPFGTSISASVSRTALNNNFQPAGTRQNPYIVYVGNDRLLYSYNGAANIALDVRVVVKPRDAGWSSEGSAVQLIATQSDNHVMAALDDGLAVIAYQDNVDNNKIKLRVLQVSGKTITAGSAQVFQGTGVDQLTLSYMAMIKIDETRFLLAYRFNSLGFEMRLVAGQVSGTTITFGTVVTTAITGVYPALALIDTDLAVLAFDDDSSSVSHARSARISGTAITLGPDSTLVALPGSQWNALLKVDNRHALACYYATFGYTKSGVVYGPSYKTDFSDFEIGPPDGIAFDDVPGLAAGDEFIIGAVPFRARFAPIVGSHMRNPKIIDGLSVWVKPDGRTVSTTRKMRVKAFRNLSDSAAVLDGAGSTEVEIPIKAPADVSAKDEELFAPMIVEGKSVEIELSNEDADTGFELVDVSAAVVESGVAGEDRSATS